MIEVKKTNINDRILEVKIDSLKELNDLKFNGLEAVLLRMEKDNLERKAEHEAKHIEIEKRFELIEANAIKDRERTDIKITNLQRTVWSASGGLVVITFFFPILIHLFWK